MKIPFPELAPVRGRPSEQQYSNLDFRDGTDALVQGVGQLSKGVSDVGNYIARRREDAKAKADETAADSLFAQAQDFTTDQLHGYDKDVDGVVQITTDAANAFGSSKGSQAARMHMPGFLETRGSEAYEKAGNVTESLQKKYESLTATAGNPEQKAIFSKRLDGLKASVQQQIATHEGQQRRVAEVAATKSLLDTTLRTAANLYNNEKEMAPFVTDAIASIKRTALPEEFEAAKADYMSKVSQTIINGYLQNDDVMGAVEKYGEYKKVLGDDGDEVKHRIDAAVKAHATLKNDVFAQQNVDAIMHEGTSLEGKPDLAKIDALFMSGPPGPLRDEMQQRLAPAKEMAARRWKEKVDTFADAASTTYEKTLNLGAVDAKVKTWLQDNAPEEWRKLRHDAEARTTHMRTTRNGDAAARREQAQIDALALKEWHEKTTEERAVDDPGAFLRGRGVSPIGASSVRGDQTKAKEILEKGDAIGEGEFVAKVKAATQGLVGADKEKAKDINSQAVQAYGDLRAKAKGKPSSAEVQAEVDRLSAIEATKPRFLESVRGKGTETTIEKQAREQKERKGKITDTTGKVSVVTSDGKKGSVPAANLEAWLAAHPGSKRAQ